MFLIPIACDDSSESADETTAEQEQGPVTIDFQVSGEAEETAVYQTVVAAFEEENPNVTVRLTEIEDRDEHLQRLATAFAGGEPPEVFLINFRQYSQFVAQGAVEAIGPHLEEAGLDPADYYDIPLEAFTYDGRTPVLPAEHLVAGRLLQQGPLQAGRDREAVGRLDLGRLQV